MNASNNIRVPGLGHNTSDVIRHHMETPIPNDTLPIALIRASEGSFQSLSNTLFRRGLRITRSFGLGTGTSLCSQSLGNRTRAKELEPWLSVLAGGASAKIVQGRETELGPKPINQQLPHVQAGIIKNGHDCF